MGLTITNNGNNIDFVWANASSVDYKKWSPKKVDITDMQSAYQTEVCTLNLNRGSNHASKNYIPVPLAIVDSPVLANFAALVALLEGYIASNGTSNTYEGTATAGQTVVNAGFDLNTVYLVFVDGSIQNASAYTKTGAAQITFGVPLLGGETIKIINLS